MAGASVGRSSFVVVISGLCVLLEGTWCTIVVVALSEVGGQDSGGQD